MFAKVHFTALQILHLKRLAESEDVTLYLLYSICTFSLLLSLELCPLKT